MSLSKGYLYHPINGSIEETWEGFSWPCFFLGGFWYIAKGLWGVIGLIASCVTFGFSWIVFPFFANRQYENYLLQKGYLTKQQWQEKRMVQLNSNMPASKSIEAKPTSNNAPNKELNTSTKPEHQKSIISNQTEDNDILFTQAYEEFESQIIDKSIMARAIIIADGSPAKERALYIKMRVDKLKKEQLTQSEEKPQNDTIKQTNTEKRTKPISNIDDLWTYIGTVNREIISKYFYFYSSILSSQDKLYFSEEFNLSTKIWGATHQVTFSCAVLCLLKKNGIENFNIDQQIGTQINDILKTLPSLDNIELSDRTTVIIKDALEKPYNKPI